MEFATWIARRIFLCSVVENEPETLEQARLGWLNEITRVNLNIFSAHFFAFPSVIYAKRKFVSFAVIFSHLHMWMEEKSVFLANVALTHGIAINGTFSMNILCIIMQRKNIYNWKQAKKKGEREGKLVTVEIEKGGKVFEWRHILKRKAERISDQAEMFHVKSLSNQRDVIYEKPRLVFCLLFEK